LELTLLNTDAVVFLILIGSIMVIAFYSYRALVKKSHSAELVTRLDDSKEKYRILFDSIPYALWIYNSETFEHLDANPLAHEQYGCSRDEFLKLRVIDILPEKVLEDNVTAKGKDTAKTVFLTTYLKKDGTVLDVEITVHDIEYETLNATLIMAIDLSSRDKSRIELARIAEDLRRLIDTANAPIFGIDAEGNINEWNLTASRIIGYEKSEVIGKNLVADFITDDYKDSVRTVLQRALRGLDTSNYEFPLYTQSGSRVQVLLNATARRDTLGSIIGVVGVGQDITSRIIAEEALKEERSLLAEHVKDRTEKLSLANTELARSARLKDEFLAGMSHELRTPLNAILGMSEVLEDEIQGPLNKDQQDAVSQIVESGNHLLALINDILDLAKIGAGKLLLEQRAVDIRTVTEASLRFIKQQAQKKRIRVYNTYEGNVDTIWSDERRLKQILVNLLSNAVKFTPERGLMGLTVESNIDTDTVTFTVWDKGIGIAEEDMEHLFQEFNQLDSKLSRRHSGTGLGLALVYRMVDLHGGSITVESELNLGSKFIVNLPMTKVKLDSNPVRDVGQRYQINKVLIIEDSPSDIQLISSFLQDRAVQIKICDQGKISQEEIIRYQPDLIILDLILPQKSGWEIYYDLKADPRTESVPILIISVLEVSAREMTQYGDISLLKPISEQTFHDALSELVGVDSGKPMKISKPVSDKENGLTILVAEDNEANIMTLTSYMKAVNYNIAIARNGNEAIKMAKEIKPDLILMDVQMPEMDGLEAMRNIRMNDDLKEIPIIALTALAMQGDRKRCLDAGADEYMSKPASFKKLIALMDELLEIKNT